LRIAPFAQADRLALHADFFSFGTNDLVGAVSSRTRLLCRRLCSAE
jgi:phosphoenolpyruvate-protein kinase (PTS system EI component)